jgi:hypothetical protein
MAIRNGLMKDGLCSQAGRGDQQMARLDLCRDSSCLSRLAIVVLALAGSGCTMTSNGMNPGTVTIRQPGTLPPAAAPPPEAAPSPPAPPLSGNFTGVGRLSRNHGSGCRLEIQIRNFVVTGDRVRFLSFRGTIQPDGYLQMQAGQSFISGSFDGGRFIGSYWRPHPSCTYDFVLNHVG